MSSDSPPMSATALARLQEILDRSRTTASPAIRETFGHPDRQMSAAEFVAFWNGVRLIAVATVGATGAPHIAPVHARFAGDELSMWMYENATRRADLQRDPRLALTAWSEDRSVAIAYGRARENPGERREARPGSSGAPRFIVPVRIRLTRAYAMKGPPG